MDYEMPTSISQNEKERALFRSRIMAIMTRNTELEYVKAEARLEVAIVAIQKLGITIPASIALLSGVSEEKAIELIKQYSQEENKPV